MLFKLHSTNVKFIALAFFFGLSVGYSETANFQVDHPYPDIREEVSEAAEAKRAELWDLMGLPTDAQGRDICWNNPCSIRLVVNEDEFELGQTVSQYYSGEVSSLNISITGNNMERVLEFFLPHEVTHAVLASRIPRNHIAWAEEGLASLQESVSHRQERKDLVKRALDSKVLLPLARVFSLITYPEDPSEKMIFYGQALSLTEFLFERSRKGSLKINPSAGREALKRKGYFDFLKMMEMAYKNGANQAAWSNAISDVYGFNGLEDIEAQWLASLSPTTNQTPVVDLVREPNRVLEAKREGLQKRSHSSVGGLGGRVFGGTHD